MTVLQTPFLQRQMNLLLAAGGNLAHRYPARTLILAFSLAAILFPFLAAISISEGIKLESRISVEEGADFYVARDSAGSSAPLLLSDIGRFQKLAGVARVVPRIVGRAYLKERAISIVGIPIEGIPRSLVMSSGRIGKKGEVIVGSSLCNRYGLQPGSRFYLPVNRWKRFTVAGVFSSKSSMWSSTLIFMSLEDAAELFRMKGMVTDFLIYAAPGQKAAMSVYLQMENSEDPPLRIQSKELVNSYLQKGFESRTGVYAAFYLATFALSIPLFFILTGLGWKERRNEIGTLKAIGWQTMDVMNVIFWENIFVSLIAACGAFIAAYAWVRLFNGWFIAQFFIGSPGFKPDFPVPACFLPVPLFLSFLLALTLTMTGSLYNTWRLAATPAAETMR